MKGSTISTYYNIFAIKSTMLGSKSMYVFDEVAFSAWMKARGMKFDGNVLVMYDNKAMKLTTLKSALRNKRRIYMPINIGNSSGKSGRLKNEDVEVCLNWQIDFECPEDPPK